jgi:tRNA threonylcarbamoyladenosine biosynthesis protein TsaE
MEVISHSTEETKNFASELAKKSKPGNVFALYGDLGSGKTTFVRYFTEALGSKSRVQSPTFVIVRKYLVDGAKIKRIWHLDLYRVNTKEELRNLDVTDFFSDPEAVTLIEWPEIAEGDLPKKCVNIYFKYINETTRQINV